MIWGPELAVSWWWVPWWWWCDPAPWVPAPWVPAPLEPAPCVPVAWVPLLYGKSTGEHGGDVSELPVI